MSKKIKSASADRDERTSDKTRSVVRDGTKQGILAIVFFVIAALFLLASIDKAGFVGTVLYHWFKLLLGLGYFLLPIVFIMLGITFLKSITQRFPTIKIAGSAIFVFAGLGMIDVVAQNEGGIVGHFVGTPLVKLFDVYASIILLAALLIISILIIFETEITVGPLVAWWKKLREKRNAEKKILGETYEDESTENVEVVE